MLKHPELIAKLDSLQKAAILSSAFEEEPFRAAGMPVIRTALLGDLASRLGVSYGSAVRSWDPALVGKMTRELVLEGGREGARLFVTPDLKAALDPRLAGLTEDGLLNGAFGKETVHAVHETGGAVGLSRLSLTAEETLSLDRKEEPSAIYDFIMKPFRIASSEEGCEAVFSDPKRIGTGYYHTNRALYTGVLGGAYGDAFAVGEGEPTPEATKLLRGKACPGGIAIPLQRALRRYGRLSAYEAEGSVRHSDLEEAVRDGSAFSEEMLDAAVDEILDFALRLEGAELRMPETALEEGEAEGSVPADGLPEAPSIPDSARRKLAEECIVLLKNDGLLPLAAGTKIAVLGEAYADLSALGARFEIVGTAAGYDAEDGRGDADIPEAVRATAHADAVLVLLGGGSGREISLPANRLALLDALKQAKKRVIAVVCGDLPADMAFDKGTSASLLAPADGPYAGEALARVLSGEANPSGKLARTAYDGADAYFRALREDRDNGRMRIGSFAGYRRYVTEGTQVRYPFGYGIGYSKFAYFSLKTEGDLLSFTLKNMGKYDGSEVVQVYMGPPNASRVAVKRQLIAFRKVFLRAGESKEISFRLPAECFATFNARLFSEDVETGVYRISVGSSVCDIRLECKRQINGVSREPLRDCPADYFPNADYKTVAEVGGERRIAVRKEEHKAERLLRVRKGVICAFPVFAVIAFILVTVLILSYTLDYTLLTTAGQEATEWIVYIAAICALATIPLLFGLNRKRVASMRKVALYSFPVLFVACFLLGAVLMMPEGEEYAGIALRILSCLTVAMPIFAVVATLVERELWRTQTGSNHWDKYYFEPKRTGKTTSEEEFETAFRTAVEARAAREAAEAAAAASAAPEEEKPADEVPQFYDNRLTYDVLFGDCKTFLAERGLAVDGETLASYLGALAATRLILVPAGGGASLCEGVAEYFGKKAYVDNAEKYRRYEHLFSQWTQGGRVRRPTGFADALVGAKCESAYLHTVLIRHISPDLAETLLVPIAETVSCKRAALPLAGEESAVLPPNLVIVAEIETDRLEGLPVSLTEGAAALSPACSSCEPAPKKTVLQAVGYERFAAMVRAVRDENPLTEQCWKNVDLLDGVCKSARIGNKLWLKTELHAAVEAACGAEAEDALDGALAAEVLPWLCAVWKDDVCGRTLPEALAEIFGEGHIRRSLAVAAPAGEEEA